VCCPVQKKKGPRRAKDHALKRKRGRKKNLQNKTGEGERTGDTNARATKKKKKPKKEKKGKRQDNPGGREHMVLERSVKKAKEEEERKKRGS